MIFSILLSLTILISYVWNNADRPPAALAEGIAHLILVWLAGVALGASVTRSRARE